MKLFSYLRCSEVIQIKKKPPIVVNCNNLEAEMKRNKTILKQKEIICDALLEDLRSIKGRDLAPYLLECVFDTIEPGTRIVLKFPIEMG